MHCTRTGETQSYNKLQAAQHQIEGAIANFFLGNWPSTITLAGAAEDILPPNDQFDDLFTIARKFGPEKFGKSEKEIADLLNGKRNWLKHNNVNHDQDLVFAQEDALSMLIRAVTRLQAHLAPFEPGEQISEHIAEFEFWCRKHYADWINPKTEEVCR
jgi:hypothetical protein